MKKSFPLVSIVIATKNEEQNIRKCLLSLKRQFYKPIQIIVVDNNSKDKTVKVAKKYTSDVYTAGPERSTQRNFAAKKIAKGKYLLFLDSDMTVSKNMILACVMRLEKNENVAGLYIKENVVGSSFWSKVRRFERSFYDGTVIDGLRFFQRNIFLKSGGFDERLYACEDWDLDKRMKKYGRTDFISQPIYHNESKFDLKKYLDKKGYYSVNFNVYIRKWGKNDPDIRRQFGLRYRLFWVFVEEGKWKKLLWHPLLAICMLVLRILAGWKYAIIRMKVDL